MRSPEGKSDPLALEDLHVLEVLPERTQGISRDSVFDLGLVRHRCHSVEAGSQQLMDHAADLLVIHPDLPDRNGLELLGALELLNLRIPTVICSSRTRPTALELLHPFVSVVPLDALQHPEKPFTAALERARHATPEVTFTVTDFLRLAIELGQSASIVLHLAAQLRVQLQVVGGDLWNVYTPERTGLAVLEAIAGATPSGVEVKHLRSVPSERQIPDPGTAVLQRLRRRKADRITQPVVIDNRVAGRQATHRITPAPAPKPLAPSEVHPGSGVVSAPPPESSPGDRNASPAVPDAFDRAFAAGLDCALRRNYREALAHFEEALRLRPVDRRVQFNIERVRSHLA